MMDIHFDLAPMSSAPTVRLDSNVVDAPQNPAHAVETWEQPKFGGSMSDKPLQDYGVIPVATKHHFHHECECEWCGILSVELALVSGG